jgi:hypothetical protein
VIDYWIDDPDLSVPARGAGPPDRTPESSRARIILSTLTDPIQGRVIIVLFMTQDPERVQPSAEQEHPSQVCSEGITTWRSNWILSPTNLVPAALATSELPK